MTEPNSSDTPRRHALPRIGLALIAAGLFGGCGQKGPLKLPEPAPAAAAGAASAPHDAAPPASAPR